jgi:hypothetical protein
MVMWSRALIETGNVQALRRGALYHHFIGRHSRESIPIDSLPSAAWGLCRRNPLGRIRVTVLHVTGRRAECG